MLTKQKNESERAIRFLHNIAGCIQIILKLGAYNWPKHTQSSGPFSHRTCRHSFLSLYFTPMLPLFILHLQNDTHTHTLDAYLHINTAVPLTVRILEVLHTTCPDPGVQTMNREHRAEC